MFKAPLTVLLLAMMASACAMPQRTGEERGKRDSLTPREFLGTDCVSALDAVQRFRPGWLRARGPTGFADSIPDYPRVVVDNVMMGDPTQLQWVALANVLDMRFIDAGQAAVRYGLGFTSGAIVVQTGRR